MSHTAEQPSTKTGVLDGLEPREVLGYFETLAGIPRGSGNESQVADWVVEFARSRGLEAIKDERSCVLVRKPGQGGLEDAAPLILHGHLDMVCEKAEGVDFDFVNDPIRLVVDGDYITADGTSLGADNGIGVSYILALLASDDLPHPPLEAVLTAMEELGKGGAAEFDTTQLRGRRMIDFNWITDKEILAGCSGDVTFTVDIPAEFESAPETHSAARLLMVRGLKGGHCEFDIQLERANALQVLARAVLAVSNRFDVRIAAPYGGAQNNAIPADAEVVLVARPEDLDGISDVVSQLGVDLAVEYDIADPDIRLDLGAADVPERVFSSAAAQRFTTLTLLIQHGVVRWNLHVDDRVETSNNLGTIRPTEQGVRLMSTITSALTSRKHELYDRVRALVELAGGGVATEMFGLDAPEFPYRPDSDLLAVASQAFRDVLGEEPAVEVSQCSLELGMFSRRVPVADIISIGTELHALHSPEEKVNHRSVERVWPLVKEVVSRLG
ncbi:beta-Ala-His dipeptidase [Agromyces binzhouensis]|uniref:Aminoacyl-histidine dipeptidase n=1 Tax=Agromyces binzhouensis TaxID=1817495 RepID=A0A4Q2JXW2_9MICO|nr:beta-Ala-His dipeptidase [Agromyces binzhouensis]RXZ51657.1 aminoacyl-histidine dipeptidase [Agromyces binzhouensis]